MSASDCWATLSLQTATSSCPLTFPTLSFQLFPHSTTFLTGYNFIDLQSQARDPVSYPGITLAASLQFLHLEILGTSLLAESHCGVLSVVSEDQQVTSFTCHSQYFLSPWFLQIPESTGPYACVSQIPWGLLLGSKPGPWPLSLHSCG